ncbi:hypothetical protein AAG906_022396 [Vitis piasezkii]
MAIKLVAILLVGVLAGALPAFVLAQNWLRRGQYGYCGTGNDFCGTGCQAGPCYSSGGSVSVSDVVTEDFFNGIISQAAGSCAGRTSTRVMPSLMLPVRILSLARMVPQMTQAEIAAFFAHVTHETGPGKGYYGRGPLQISWNYNYGPAGQSIGFNGLNNPETVANNPVVSFKTAFWFWMNHVHSIIGQGFGATIRAIKDNDLGRCMLLYVVLT